MIKYCVECGAEFSASPSDKKVTCSKECLKKRRSRLLKGHKVTDRTKEKIRVAAQKRGYTDNLKKGTPAAQKSPKAGRFNTNSSAKMYQIKSPEGKIYSFTNLHNWIRNNIELFNCEESERNINRISHGFYTAKRNIIKGKGTATYKDWQILYFDNRKNCEKEK